MGADCEELTIDVMSQYCTVAVAPFKRETTIGHSTACSKNIRGTVYSIMLSEIGNHASNLPCSETKKINRGSSGWREDMTVGVSAEVAMDTGCEGFAGAQDTTTAMSRAPIKNGFRISASRRLHNE
jgi:hypothetical protein